MSKLSTFECTFLVPEVKVDIKIEKCQICRGYRTVNFVHLVKM